MIFTKKSAVQAEIFILKNILMIQCKLRVKFESHFCEKILADFRHRKVRYTISDAELPVDSKNAIKNTPLAS